MLEKTGHKVAVIAVHGVADQAADKTARQTTALLLGQHLDVDYEFFDEQKVHISLDSIELDKQLLVKPDSLWQFPPIQSSQVSDDIYRHQQINYSNADSIHANELDCERYEHESMREQLQTYVPEAEDSVHETIVLKGARTGGKAASEPVEVDVYEAYWADLSRLKSGYFTVFFEFYLFLFFFSRIGGIAVERATAYFRDSKSWRLLLQLHWLSEIALVIAIPLTYLCLLSLAVSGAPYLLQSMLPNIALSTILLWLAAGSIIILGILIACKIAHHKSYYCWPLLFLLIGLITVVGIWVLKPFAEDVRLLVFLLWCYIAAGFLALCYIYNKRRPGAFLLGVVFFAITGVVFSGFLLSGSDHSLSAVFSRGVDATRWVINLNTFSWVVFVFSTLFSTLLGFFIIHRTQGKNRQIAQKTVWTQALSLILPGTLIMLISFSLLQAIYHLSTKLIPGKEIEPLQLLIDEFIFPHLSHGLIILCVGVFFAFWMVSPALFFDGLKPDKKKRKVASSWIGENLSNAYKKMRWVGELFRFMLLVALPVEWFIHMVPSGVEHHNIELHRQIILYGGLLIVFIMFGSKGPLSFLGFGFRAGLDVGLDVANWLRYRPRETNTRAAIFRRYISILSHIAQWRDPLTNKGYDQLVIIAHSQGTVITADILRFLTIEFKNSNMSKCSSQLSRFFNSGEDHIPIKLLTIGSPLRQLYSQRFPLQYHWAGCNTGESETARHGPDPDSLSLTNWTNLYCSGDYVGRHLWYEDNDENIWAQNWGNHNSTGFYLNAKEKCLGAGGHTNYWSGELPEVAIELDRLIYSQSGLNQEIV